MKLQIANKRHRAYRRFSDNNTGKALIYKLNVFHVGLFDTGSLLDFGCQEGQFADMVRSQLGITDISCADIGGVSVKNGKKRFPEFDWYCSDILDFKYERTYDMISSLNGFFYLNEQERLHIYRTVGTGLNPDGIFLVSYGDINFMNHQRMTADEFVTEISKHMNIVNIIHAIEYGLHSPAGKDNDCLGRWYTSLALTTK